MKNRKTNSFAIQPVEYDEIYRWIRDKGWMDTDQIIASGITTGVVLEIGSGPGYLGLEWLKKTKWTYLKTIEFRNEMIPLALKNAGEYEIGNRIEFHYCDCEEIPFPGQTFTAVFSTGTLHEWENPVKVFNEINRVLKRGGRYFIGDLKRNMNGLIKFFIKLNTRNKNLQHGFEVFVSKSYTYDEIKKLVSDSLLVNACIKETITGIEITGIK